MYLFIDLVSQKVQKWGNSPGISIRWSIADQWDLKGNTEFDITIQDNKLVIDPCRKQYTLSALLEGVKPEDLHDEMDFHVSTSQI